MVQAKWSSCIIDRGSRFHSVIRLCADMGRTAYDHIKCSLSQMKRERMKHRERESSPQEKKDQACLTAETGRRRIKNRECVFEVRQPFLHFRYLMTATGGERGRRENGRGRNTKIRHRKSSILNEGKWNDSEGSATVGTKRNARETSPTHDQTLRVNEGMKRDKHFLFSRPSF